MSKKMIPVDGYLPSADKIAVHINPVYLWGSDDTQTDFVRGKLFEFLSEYKAALSIYFDSEPQWLSVVVYVHDEKVAHTSTALSNEIKLFLNSLDRNDIINADDMDHDDLSQADEDNTLYLQDIGRGLK